MSSKKASRLRQLPFTQQPAFALLQCLRKHTQQCSESTERTKSQMITNCGLMPFQDIRAETAPYWGYEKHDRRLHLHCVGHADVLFLSTRLTELNRHCRPKIQTHASCCRGAKMSTASGNALLPSCVKEKENTSHSITTHCDTCTHTLCLHAASWQLLHTFSLSWNVLASFISLIPLFKHNDVCWSTDQYQSPAGSDDCITKLLETTRAGKETKMQEHIKK